MGTPRAVAPVGSPAGTPPPPSPAGSAFASTPGGTPGLRRQSSLFSHGFNLSPGSTPRKPTSSTFGLSKDQRTQAELSRQLEETRRKELAREAHKQAKRDRLGRILDPAAKGRGFSALPKSSGRPATGLTRGTAVGAKSNKRLPGENVLRRDKTAVDRVTMILAVERMAKLEQCNPKELSNTAWISLCTRFAETKAFLLNLLPRKA